PHRHHPRLAPLPLPHLSPPAIYTLSLHDALPIYSQTSQPRCPACKGASLRARCHGCACRQQNQDSSRRRDDAAASTHKSTESSADWKSTRLNSSHRTISYAVFCLKKKRQQKTTKQ